MTATAISNIIGAPLSTGLLGLEGLFGFHGWQLMFILEGVPSVLCHNDLGLSNIVVSAADFMVVDWEDARPGGLPLSDLATFLVEALAHLDGVLDPPEVRDAYNARLLRGELDSSELLFRYMRDGARAVGIADEAVGSVLTLHWLQRGVVQKRRVAEFGADVASKYPEPSPLERIAPFWLKDPLLGPAWRAFSR